MLSVVINTRNEEKNLPGALSSAKNISDEIILVDSESSDKTVEIAKKFGCRIFTHKYTGIVEPVRNFALSKAKGDWIFILDADEEITASLAAQIKKVIKENKADYYRIPRQNIIFNKAITSSHWWPDYVYRLFKKGSVSWDDKIHSLPFTRGVGADFPAKPEFALIHHNYTSVSQFIDRLNVYTDFQAREIIASGYNFAWSDLLLYPMREFNSQYFARRGYRDGIHGLSLSLLQAFSSLTVYLKIWQERGFTGQNLDLVKVKSIAKTQFKETRWWYFTSLSENTNILTGFYWKIIRKFKS